jgi:glyoxylase-like metal-dependent hydrolase (beta-lactamase superfamily II)
MKLEGTENVYIFRAGNHQSMFVVTSAGVIATDPIGYGRPEMVSTYVDEIRKVTNQPIRYVIYSHHHFDHIAGGKPFRDVGARFLSHKRAKERLVALKDPHTVVPDETMDKSRIMKLGGTTLELTYVGLNHSDSSLVMRLPKEKVLFAVDFIPVGSMPGLAMIDSYPLEWEASLKKVLAMDWDTLIPGHPGQPGGRLGTKDDVQKVLTFLQDASAAVKTEAQAGGCWDRVETELKLPKYESWPGYERGLPMVLRRYCMLWGRGT